MKELLLLAIVAMAVQPRTLGKDWIEFPAGEGPGNGRRVVLISGDEEYRSEEGLPQLAKILSTYHGFQTTVLFAITDGYIDPANPENIPGLEALDRADLMVIMTRWRNLPDSQMQSIDRYLRRGGPVIGLRTATHAFKIPAGRAFSYYSDGYDGERKHWQGGFGRLVLGEMWISHHGQHGHQATRGFVSTPHADHPVLRGCEDIFGPSDVYTVRLPLPGDSLALVYGAVLDGMEPTDPPVTGPKNNPRMPVAWVKTYRAEEGPRGRVFATTMGASEDLKSEGLRRLIVNAAYWCLELEDRIPEAARVDLVGTYSPSPFGFKADGYWPTRKLTPADLQD